MATSARSTSARPSTKTAARAKSPQDNVESLGALLTPDYVPMRQMSGKVTGVWGQAFVRKADGTLKALVVGDELVKGDVVMTSQNGLIQLNDEGARLARLPNIDSLERVLVAVDAGDAAPAAGFASGGNLGPGYRVDRMIEVVGGNEYTFDGVSTAGSLVGPNDVDNFVSRVASVEPGGPGASDDGVPEGTTAPNTLVYTVTLTGLSSTAQTLPFSIGGGTAEANDYGAATFSNGVVNNGNGTITIPGGVSSFTVSIPTVADGVVENDETLPLTVDGITGTGSIDNDDSRPSAAADSFTANEDGSVSVPVLVNDSDLDGDTLTVTQVNGSPITAGGPAIAVANGTVSLTTAGELLFTPTANYNGPASFTYTVSDPYGNTATATASGTVAAVNDAPTAAADSFSTNEDTAVTVQVLANDTDIDGDTLSVTQVNGGAITAGGPAVAVTNGSVALTTAGELVFTPAANYNGPASFTYTVSDGNGSTATATVSGTVVAVNDAPTAVADTFTTNEDTAVTVAVLTNDSDVDGDTLTVTQVNSSAITAGGPAVAVTNGSVALTTAGELVFTPAANYNGPASFTYTVSDGSGSTATATVSGSVAAINDAPNAVADTFTTNEDTAVTVAVLTNDSDIDGDTLTVTQVNGSAITAGGAAVAVTNGSVVLTAAGELIFTPSANYSGAASFTYTVADGTGLTSTANVTGTVTAVPDAPLAQPDTFTTNEDTAVTVAVLANDSDADGDTLTVTQVNGSAITAGGAAVAVTNGSVVLTTAGELVFTPAANYSGAASFTYTVADGTGLTSTANVTGTVTAVPDAPLAQPDTFTTNEDTAVTVAVLANDSDADGDTLTVTQVNGSAITAGGAAVAVTNGSVVLTTAGELVFTPAANYSGAASFTYTVADGTGLTSTANVTGTVTAVPDAPLAQPDTFTTNEDTAVTVAVLANDSDADGDTLTVTQVNGSAITAGGAAVAVTNGSVVLTTAGELVFTPAANYSGAASFTYTVADGTGLTSTANVTGTVTAVPDAPLAQPDTFTTNEDTAVTVAVLANDSDADGDTLTVTQVNGSAITAGGAAVAVTNGSVVLTTAGELVFTPAANYSGAASFTYTVADGTGLTSTANVTGTVAEVNDPPINTMPTSTAALSMNEDGENNLGAVTGPIVFSSARSTAISVGDADSGDTLTTVITVTNGSFTVGSSSVTGVEVRNNGSASVTLIGTAAAITAALEGSTYVNAADFNGSATLTVRSTDPHGVVDQDSTTLTVNAVQDAVLDSAITNEGQAVTIQVLGNDSYEDSSALITAVNGQAIATGQSVSVANGTVTLNSDGTLSFAPSSGYSNTAETPTTFTYTVTAGGKTEAAMVAVQVTPAADLALSANGYWTFDNSTTTGITTTTANEQATTQIGTLSGDARIGAGTHDGNALVLSSSDGSNDFLALDSTVTSALVGGAASSQATLAFWINTTQRGSSNGYSSPSVIGNSASGNNDIQWGWLNSSGQIGIARGSANTSVSDTVVADGTWHQVTIGYDFDAEVAKIYVDGVLEYSGDLLADSVVTQLAGLGVTSGQSGALSTYLNGQLDDVRIYDRVLTDAEVSAIYVSESLTTAAGAVTVDSVSSDGSVQFAIDGGLHASISLSGAPAGAVLSDGNGHSLTLTGGSGVISNPSAWNLDQLKLSNLGGMSALLSIESTQTGGTLANSTLNIVAAHHATASNETLSGGTGTDVFAWSLGDVGSDQVQGFEAVQAVNAGGDVLDLRDLLSGETGANLENYLSFETSGSSTVLHISTQGQFASGSYDASKENATITLSGTSLASDLGLGSAATDAQLIAKMLDQGKLLVDNG
jgi:hypothetical protein